MAESINPKMCVNKIGNNAILRDIFKKYGHEEIYLNRAKMGFTSDMPGLFSDSGFKEFIMFHYQQSRDGSPSK